MATRRDSGGGGFVGVLGMLFLLGLIVKYIWWIVGAAAVIGLSVGIYYVSRAAIQRAEERRALEERREEDLRIRAERQRRWTLLGDSRAIYGEDGDAATRAVADPSSRDDRPIARMATTAGELAALKRDRPQAWEHALFASVLAQRTAAVLPRLRDSELGFTATGSVRIPSASYLASRLSGLLDQMLATTQQLATFMNAPAFMAAFGRGNGVAEPDADAVEHIAHRLMDYQERLLELSEQCRELSAPSAYTDVIADCARLLDMPLQGIREFTAEYVAIIEAMPRVLEHARGTIHLGGLALDLDVDDALLSATEKRLHAMSR